MSCFRHFCLCADSPNFRFYEFLQRPRIKYVILPAWLVVKGTSGTWLLYYSVDYADSNKV